MTFRRVGGRATTLTGGQLIWTAAEGARGTRWREATEIGGVLVRSVLLEVSSAGRMTRLEVTTVGGLLTLHPDPDESAIHGNVVGPDGVRHLAFGWSPDHDLLLVGSPASAGVALRRQARTVDVGASAWLELLRIDDALDPRPVRWSFTRTSSTAWHLRSEDGSDERRWTLDADGDPELPDAVIWPLEP
ncbi:MAG: hypothetical protein ACRDIL_10395 [Candidatus Limnocylindrales bacterium]